MTDPRDPLRAELTRLLAERGWSYYRAMVQFHWSMNWDARREANPPAVELLSEGQVRHLCDLLRTNVRAKA